MATNKQIEVGINAPFDIGRFNDEKAFDLQKELGRIYKNQS